MRSSSTARFGALVAVTMVAAIALASCSSGSGSSDSGSAGGTWAKSEGTIVFGAVPDKAGSDTNIKPLEEYIAQQTGYTVEYYPTADYTALIAAAVAGKVDLVSSGALQFLKATTKGAELEPVAAQLSSPEVTDPGYYSEAIVPASSTMATLADAKGKRVCFVDPNSTSGFLYGLFQLQKAGINVDSTGTDANGDPTFADFTPYFAGAHDKSAQAVATSQCDVGFAEDTVVTPAVEKGDVKLINKEYVPGAPLSISTALPDEAKTKLTEALQGATLEAIESSGVALTDGFKDNYFGVQNADAAYYQGITDLCKTISAAKCAD